MNRKKLLAVTALAMSCLLFSACTNTSSKMSFSANWYQDTTAQTVSDAVETLEYTITADTEGYSGLSDDYFKTTYSTGKYTTKLAPKTLENGDIVYEFSTRTELPVSFFHVASGESTEVFTDVIECNVLFSSIYNGGLRPIQSSKTIQSHSPINGQPSSKNDCYRYYHYNVTTTYADSENGSSVLTDYEGNILGKEAQPKTTDFTIDTAKYSYLDNEQILFALRGANTMSNKILAYNASKSKVETINVTFGSEKADTYEFLLNGESKKASIAAIPVSLEIDDINSGGVQNVWYAKTTDVKNNVYRNVMLKFESPISYNIGKLVYTLTSANFA